ncbi:MAG: hypothetical protein IPK97_03050 [Ahniella sp.]|nr:hypothetical protein [Ahniella sp.]
MSNISGSKTFCLAVDCNIAFGSVSFAIGTSKDIESSDRMNIEGEGGSSDDQKLTLPVMIGNWQLHSGAQRLTPVFYQSWAPVEAEIEQICYREMYRELDNEELSTAFGEYVLEQLAVEVHKLDMSGAFSRFSRSSDFKFYVGDHDEPVSVGLARMLRKL